MRPHSEAANSYDSRGLLHRPRAVVEVENDVLHDPTVIPEDPLIAVRQMRERDRWQSEPRLDLPKPPL
jgi:hypothetical protein